ncbi:CPBP family intramembrane glutamic endopeptidase [Sorangium sp. So ce1000]|uniref:CPBP family intramembrane glutamic endopeptidase n=1 Tax=Sorangium sp. So ce1000 TaxID=3133325 RepID=UPI003F637189
MRGPWRDTLTHVAWPLVALVVLFVVKKARGLSWRDDFGLRLPTLQDAALWLGLFVTLAVIEEVVSRALGFARVEPWGTRFSTPEMVIRVATMVVLAPVSEELLFRGLLFKEIGDTAAGTVGAIGITAVLFAAVHGQYQLPVLTLIVIDGLFYGITRHVTGSTLLTILLHSLGNAYAAYERISR